VMRIQELQARLNLDQQAEDDSSKHMQVQSGF
jgi:hypothetical protein